MNFLQNKWGSILVETALVFPVLLILFGGIVEIAQFVDAKERVNRVANRLVDIYSELPPDTTVDSLQRQWQTHIMPVLAEMTAPHQVNVNVTFCSKLPVFPRSPATHFSLATRTKGICGYGNADVKADPLPEAVCPRTEDYPPDTSSVMVIVAGCNYSPMIHILNLFPLGLQDQVGNL